jgi:NADH-quinone oxidoreductase subunit J
MTDIIFYLVAALMVVFAVLTVALPNILMSAAFLVATFMGTAALYILLGAEFLAVAQVMVYIGGVVIFIVFTILLTSQLGEKALQTGKARKVFAAFLALIFFGTFGALLLASPTSFFNTPPDGFGGLLAFGQRLLSYGPEGFLIPFEIVSLLLLASLIGAITIAHRPRSEDRDIVKKISAQEISEKDDL